MRKLKFHERKLLKKHDFISWKTDRKNLDNYILRRYNIQNRNDCTRYKNLCRDIRHILERITALENSTFKVHYSKLLLSKLYDLGLIHNKSDATTASKMTEINFCRRRLPTVMVKNKFIQTIQRATELITHGNVRVGLEIVKDSSMLISPNLEDFITWVDNCKLRRCISNYIGIEEDC